MRTARSGVRLYHRVVPACSSIDLHCIANTGTFARYQPFSDERQVVVRRGTELGHGYGLQHAQERRITISGVEVTITRHSQILSPPVLEPGSERLTPEAARRYRREHDVVRLPDAEVMIPRSPDGFTDDEVALILAAITVT